MSCHFESTQLHAKVVSFVNYFLNFPQISSTPPSIRLLYEKLNREGTSSLAVCRRIVNSDGRATVDEMVGTTGASTTLRGRPGSLFSPSAFLLTTAISPWSSVVPTVRTGTVVRFSFYISAIF